MFFKAHKKTFLFGLPTPELAGNNDPSFTSLFERFLT